MRAVVMKEFGAPHHDRQDAADGVPVTARAPYVGAHAHALRFTTADLTTPVCLLGRA
jgi:hypothetical protein